MEDREESEALVSPCLVWESKVESVSRYLRPIQRKKERAGSADGPPGRRKAASTQGSIASPGKGSNAGPGAPACGMRQGCSRDRKSRNGRQRESGKKNPHCSVHFVRKKKHGERRSGKPTHGVIK